MDCQTSGKHGGISMGLMSDRLKPFFRPLALVLVLFTLTALSGCADVNLANVKWSKIFKKKKAPIVNKTAEQLIHMGMDNLGKRHFSDAADDFKKLKEEYPYSKYATLASLKLGDAYFGEQKYVEAGMSYEEFARLHPNSKHTPYVLYRAGMSHFLMFTAADRDPAETRKAIKIFDTLIANYPGSEYAAKARRQLIECKKRLAVHIFTMAKQFYLSGHYPAAKGRLDSMEKKYPTEIAELGYGPSIKKMLAKCQVEIAKGPPRPSRLVRWGF